MNTLEKFLQESILGIIILGACGSILGYLLILFYKQFLKYIHIIFFWKTKTPLERFKEKYINENVEARVLLDEHNTNKGFVFTKLLIDFIFYLGIYLVLSVIYIQILLFSIEINNEFIRYFVFLLGFISSFPMYKIGYLRSGYKVFYKNFIKYSSSKIEVEELEKQAIDKFNNQKSKP